MSNNVLLSIIVPVYNVKHYLKDCLDSICNQSFREFEIIIIDDGSTDGSGELCDVLVNNTHNNIRVIHSENRGLAEARNLGINHSSGLYLGFVDSDDMIHPQMYEVLMKEALHTKADTVSCCYEKYTDSKIVSMTEIDIKNAVFERMNSKEYVKDFWNKAFLRIGVPQWCSIYKSSMFKKFGVNTDYKYYEDLNTLPDILENSNRVSYTELRLYYYRISGTSITRSPMNQDKVDKLGSWKNRIIPFLEKNCDEESIIKGYQTYIDRYESIARLICEEKNSEIFIPREYKQYLKKALHRCDKFRVSMLNKHSIYMIVYYYLLMINYRLWYKFIQ